jgi:hypothetical protein
MSTNKFIAAALAAATLAGSVLATTGTAQAGSRGVGLGLGIAAGALVGAAVVNNAYAGPTYVVREHRRCHWVRNYDGYGYYVGKTRVCNY